MTVGCFFSWFMMSTKSFKCCLSLFPTSVIDLIFFVCLILNFIVHYVEVRKKRKKTTTTVSYFQYLGGSQCEGFGVFGPVYVYLYNRAYLVFWIVSSISFLRRYFTTHFWVNGFISLLPLCAKSRAVRIFIRTAESNCDISSVQPLALHGSFKESSAMWPSHCLVFRPLILQARLELSWRWSSQERRAEDNTSQELNTEDSASSSCFSVVQQEEAFHRALTSCAMVNLDWTENHLGN